MSAAKIEIDWMNDGWEQETFTFTETRVRQIARPRPHLRCPECNSIIYTRSHRLCGVCGSELPMGHLFSVSEAVRLKRLLLIERQRHREWLNRL